MKEKPIEELLSTTAKLRSPDGGCPWDLVQTHQSLRKYLLEEVYEVLDAIDQGDMTHLAEELGDLLFQIVLHAQIAEEGGHFSFYDIATQLNQKMIRRHPHVFSEGARPIEDMTELTQQWERIKQAEKKDSPFASIPRELPGLARATKIIKKAQKQGVSTEFRTELPSSITSPDELANLLWATCTRCIELKIDPEDLLRQANSQLQAQYENQISK